MTTFWRGIWWSLSLITTVGFLGNPPTSGAGAVLSVALMLLGFLLLAMVSASLASVFVRDDEAPIEQRSDRTEHQILTVLARMEARLDSLEERLDAALSGRVGSATAAGAQR